VVAAAAYLLSAGCEPTHKCGGQLYYDPINSSCRPCPKNARFEAGSCVCPEAQRFVEHRCIAASQANDPEQGDAGGIEGSAALGCTTYCDFVKQCFADNELVRSALQDVLEGLYADMSEACVRRCSGASGAEQPIARCLEERRAEAACEASGQEGLKGAITLMAECCRGNPEDPLRGQICEGLTSSPLVAEQIDFCE
jgi:hypothetical protein